MANVGTISGSVFSNSKYVDGAVENNGSIDNAKFSGILPLIEKSNSEIGQIYHSVDGTE